MSINVYLFLNVFIKRQVKRSSIEIIQYVTQKEQISYSFVYFNLKGSTHVIEY